VHCAVFWTRLGVCLSRRDVLQARPEKQYSSELCGETSHGLLGSTDVVARCMSLSAPEKTLCCKSRASGNYMTRPEPLANLLTMSTTVYQSGLSDISPAWQYIVYGSRNLQQALNLQTAQTSALEGGRRKAMEGFLFSGPATPDCPLLAVSNAYLVRIPAGICPSSNMAPGARLTSDISPRHGHEGSPIPLSAMEQLA
jgi:hypothetical protein